MTRDELARETQHVELVEALDAAKDKAFHKNASEADHDTLKQAETALSAFRIAQRNDRDATAPEAGVAAPAPVKTSTKKGG